jgi:prophage regulatory protein
MFFYKVNNMATNKLIRLKDLTKQYAIPASTVWYWIKQGNFPKQIKLGTRFVAWRESDIIAWLDGKQNNNMKGEN